MCPAVCYPLAVGTKAVLFAKKNLGRPAVDTVGSQFYLAVSIEIACAWSPASQILRSLWC